MLLPDQLTQSVAAEWDRIAVALGSQRSRFEAQLIPLLRKLEAPSDDISTTIEQILDLFAAFNPAHELLRERLQRLAAASAKGGSARVEQKPQCRCIGVPVFFVTNREPSDSDCLFFGAGRGQLAFGMAHVTIPDDHRMGQLEQPQWWKLQFREDQAKHVMVHSLHSLPQSQFRELASSTLAESRKKDALVFVHGYNVGFRDALLRCAQITYDLQFEGIPILYSWPSEGAVLSYAVDGGNVLWSRPHFTAFVDLARTQLGAEGLHILAHSMGNRLLTESIASFTAPEPRTAQMRQIIFAAPDVDAATFKDLAGAFAGRAERFTLYASSDDKALKLSKSLHKYSRAGESGLDLVIVNGIDTVDASMVDTSLLGHSYFGDTHTLLSDIFYLIREGKPPDERFGLDARSRYGTRYWSFRR